MYWRKSTASRKHLPGSFVARLQGHLVLCGGAMGPVRMPGPNVHQPRCLCFSLHHERTCRSDGFAAEPLDQNGYGRRLYAERPFRQRKGDFSEEGSGFGKRATHRLHYVDKQSELISILRVAIGNGGHVSRCLRRAAYFLSLSPSFIRSWSSSSASKAFSRCSDTKSADNSPSAGACTDFCSGSWRIGIMEFNYHKTPDSEHMYAKHLEKYGRISDRSFVAL